MNLARNGAGGLLIYHLAFRHEMRCMTTEPIIGAATSHGRQMDDQTILLARISGLGG
jgi:hypothetical protein